MSYISRTLRETASPNLVPENAKSAVIAFSTAASPGLKWAIGLFIKAEKMAVVE